MRLDLEPKRVKLGSGELGLEPRLAKLQPPGAMMRGERAAADQQHPVDQKIDGEAGRQLADKHLREAVCFHRNEGLKPDGEFARR